MRRSIPILIALVLAICVTVTTAVPLQQIIRQPNDQNSDVNIDRSKPDPPRVSTNPTPSPSSVPGPTPTPNGSPTPTPGGGGSQTGAGNNRPTPSPATGTAPAGAQAQGGTNAGVIIGSVLGALALVGFLILLAIMLKRRDRSEPSGVAGEDPSSSDSPGPGGGTRGLPPGAGGNALAHGDSDGTIQDIELAEAETSVPRDDFVTDSARHHGPISTGAKAAGAGAAGAAAAGAAGAVATRDTPSAAAMMAARGPSPPPHDYVVGAGPTASRTDFEDIRTRFERDEIGDKSAILGGSGSAKDVLSEKFAEAEEGPSAGTRELPGTDVVGAAGIALQEADVIEEGENSFALSAGLPDRSGEPVPVSFDTQERLLFGGDNSGAVSDATPSLTGGSILEESGAVASLEHDPLTGPDDI